MEISCRKLVLFPTRVGGVNFHKRLIVIKISIVDAQRFGNKDTVLHNLLLVNPNIARASNYVYVSHTRPISSSLASVRIAKGNMDARHLFVL